jgi:hypothetical protein
LIRVPLAALIEVDYPRQGPGYLDLERAEEALRGATKLYVTDNITVYENDTPLPMPSLDSTFPADARSAVLAALMLTGGVWLASGWLSRWIKPDRMPPASDLAAHAQASGAESD